MNATITKILMRLGFMLALSTTSLHAQVNGWLQTGAGPHNYTNTANWVGGTVNGIWDTSLTLTAAQTATFADDTLIPSLAFNYTGNFDVTLRSDGTTNRTIALGGDISVAPVSTRTVTIGSSTANNGLNINLGGATRTFNANASRGLVILNAVTNGGLIITGSGAVTLSGVNTFAGGVALKAGKVRFGSTSALGTGVFNVGDTVGATTVALEATGSLVNSQNNPQNWNQDFAFGNVANLNLGTGVVTLAGSRAIDVTGWTLTVGGAIGGGPYSITKNGANGNLVLNGANTYGGGTVINAGRLQFGPDAVPSTGSILINPAGALSTGSSYGTLQGWLDSGKIDKTSSGTLALTANSSESINFNTTGYSNLLFGASSASTYTGTLTPWNGVYRLGGGGAALTFSAANTLTGPNRLVVGSVGSAAGTPTFTASQNFTGATAVDGQTLSLSGADGTFTASAITVNQAATLNFNSPAGVAGATRVAAVTLKTGTLTVTGNNTANSVDSISGALTLDNATTGGTDFIDVTANAAKNAQLVVSSLVRTNGQIAVITGSNLGAAPGNGVANVKVTSAPTAIGGGGEANTVNVSIVPWVIGTTNVGGAALSFETYSPTSGFRPLNVATEYDILTNGFSGTVSGTDHNVRIPASATVTLTGDNTINSLYMGTATAGATLNGAGTLKVTSGAVFLAANSTTTIAMPLDFGTAQGVIGFWKGKASTISSSIAGSGGLVLYQATPMPATGSGGTGVTLSGPCTYTGDTFVVGKAFVNSSSVLPNGSRTGNVHISGILEINNGVLNGLNGTGMVTKPSSGGGTLVIGDNNAHGDFSGTITGNTGWTIVKIGSGTQRLGGVSTYTTATTVSNGTLIVDGTIVSPTTVLTNAILRGKGTIDKSGTAITVNNGGMLAPGDANGIGTMTVLQGNVAFANGAFLKVKVGTAGACLLDVAGTVTNSVAGTVTIPVTVEGAGSGKWRVIKATSITPTFTSATSGCTVTIENSGTELWVNRLSKGTLISIL